MMEANERGMITQPVIDLLNQSKTLDLTKVDHLVSSKQIEMRMGQMVVPDTLTGQLFAGVESWTNPMEMTDHAFGQLRARLGPTILPDHGGKTLAKADWSAIRKEWPVEFGDMLESMLDKLDKPVLVRTNAGIIRAILSEQYRIIDNTDILTGVLRVMTESADQLTDLSVKRSAVTPDYLSCRVLVMSPQDENGDQRYSVGFHVSNDEVGRGGIRVSPFVWREVCSNGMIVTSDIENASLNVTHRMSKSAVMALLVTTITNILPLAAQTLERIYEAEVAQLPSLATIVAGIADERGWSESQRDAVLMGTEGQHTHMGLVNGVTAVARTFEQPEVQDEWERLGGTLLNLQPAQISNRYHRVAASV